MSGFSFSPEEFYCIYCYEALYIYSLCTQGGAEAGAEEEGDGDGFVAEVEQFEVELMKDVYGLGITIAGYVGEQPAGRFSPLITTTL